MEPVPLAATGTSIVGFAMMAIAIVALVVSIRDAVTRLLALGVKGTERGAEYTADEVVGRAVVWR